MSFSQFRIEFKRHFKFSNYFNQIVTYNFGLFFGFAFYKLKVKPNTITIISLILGGLGCYFLLNKEFLISAALLFSSVVSDYCDGVISRITKTQTGIGKMLDILVDRTVDTVFWFLIFFISESQNIYFLITISLIVVSHTFVNISYEIESNKAINNLLNSKYKWIRRVVYIPLEVDFLFIFLPLVLALNFYSEEFISLIAVGSVLRMLYILKKANVKK